MVTGFDINEIAKACNENKCEISVRVDPAGQVDIDISPWKPTKHEMTSHILPVEVEGEADDSNTSRV